MKLEKEERELYSDIKELEDTSNKINEEIQFFSFQYKKMEFYEEKYLFIHSFNSNN